MEQEGGGVYGEVIPGKYWLASQEGSGILDPSGYFLEKSKRYLY
jgi:hypothetical protein